MFNLIITDPAREDIDLICDYFSIEKQEPYIANNLLETIYRKLLYIELMPNAMALVKDNSLAKLGYRLFQVNNYLLFYTIDDFNKLIEVRRFLHSSRDWANILKEDIEDS